MNKKSSNFFEEHIEKIILIIVGLVGIWFLATRVFVSPNYTEYDSKQLGPGDIDTYISEQAERLKDKLNRNAEIREAYKPRVDSFIALVDSAISDIDLDLSLSVPPNISRDIIDDRKYRVPHINRVSDVGVEHIRAVAYVPTGEIDLKNTYDEMEPEPEDLDLVTVEAKFDVAQLYKMFNESFAGEDVSQEWRDPCLAEPIFAAVHLQRQEQLYDGSWSEWQVVPRTRIEARSEMFEIIEEVAKLPAGGVKVRMLQFNDEEVLKDLLQPGSYKIASAKEEWFPPSLHKKFVKVQADIDMREKREAKAVGKDGRGKRTEARRSRSSRPKASTGSTGSGGFTGLGGGMFDSGTKKKTTRKNRDERGSGRDRLKKSREASKTTIDDIYEEFDDILITEDVDLAEMRQPLAVWANDDTVEPGKSYRYRIRLGVFNPIAGTNQFVEQDKPKKNKVILWSEFSDTTKIVEIPERLYFFPLDIQEAAKTVTITVCRYALGYWYSKDFAVKPGEVIGKVVKPEFDKEEEQEDITIPETIDYSTGAVLVDVRIANDWLGEKNLRARYYFDMLYSFDATNIDRFPIKAGYWPGALQIKFSEINKAKEEEKEPLRDWSGKAGRGRRSPGQSDQMPGMPGMPGMFGF